MQNTIGKRNSNLELLRILSMFMIIALHALRTGYDSSAMPLYVYIPSLIIGSWGIVGVDLFVIISAWFMVDQKFKMSRMLNILFQVLSYIIIFTIIRMLVIFHRDGNSISVFKDLIFYEYYEFLQPLWSKDYWFVSAYLFMYLCSPLLNKVLNNFSQKDIKKVLIIFSFIPIITNFSVAFDVIQDVANFLYLYVLVGYIKKYVSYEIIATKKNCLLTFFVSVIVFFSSRIIMDKLGNYAAFGLIYDFLRLTVCNNARSSFIMLIISFSIFFFTIQKKEKYHIFINTFSSYTLGVYLIHERKVLDGNNEHVIDFFLKWLEKIGFIVFDRLFVFRFLVGIIILYLVCILIEMIRKNFIQKPFMNYFLQKNSIKIQKIDDWFNN